MLSRILMRHIYRSQVLHHNIIQLLWGYVLATTLEDKSVGSENCMLHDTTNAQTAEHYDALGVILSYLLLQS
jgi:hypothetical protein